MSQVGPREILGVTTEPAKVDAPKRSTLEMESKYGFARGAIGR